jgi:hypothetical protein
MSLISSYSLVRIQETALCSSFSGKTSGRDPDITGSIPVLQSTGFSSVGRALV